jgi:hypothetical protein
MRNKIKIFLTAFAATLIFASSFQTAFAGVWTNYYSGAYVQGASRGGAGKRVSKISNALWLAEIASFTSPAIAIPVGWTYWTSREICNGYIIIQKIHAPRSIVKTSTYDYQYMTTKPCSQGVRRGQVLGRHEVKGSKFIFRLDWTQSEIIP